MRKLSLLLSVLIFFISIVPLSHASSGDITIGTKTYTQSEAQKQIVKPLLERLERQKITKTKLRLINLTIRQYTNKQKIAQKQGKTDLVKFYNGIIDTLKGKINITATEAVNGLGGNISMTQNRSTSNQIDTTKPSINNDGGAGTTQGTLTGVVLENNKIEGEVRLIFNSYKEFGATKQQFLNEVIKNYGINSYAYKFAQTLSFGSSSTHNANQGGLGTTSDQTGLTGQAYDESKTRGEVNGEYRNIDLSVVSKAQFLQYISDNYGGTSSYAYQFAQTLSFSK